MTPFASYRDQEESKPTQSTTYQNFPIKHVQQKQLSGHDVTATISSQISKQIESDKEADRQKFILNRERNIELINHNAAERELRGIQEQTERNRDRFLLDANLNRETAMIELEEREKAARRQEIVDLQIYYRQGKDDKAKYEREVDEVVAQEAERQFKMRDA